MAGSSELSNKTVMVWDFGMFFHVAQALAAEGKFQRVGYYSQWEQKFPKSENREVGDGFDGIERIDYAEDFIDEADLIIFPDCYMGAKLEFLRGIGKRVWGPGYGEFLEIDRVKAKAAIAAAGLPETDWQRVKGLDKLRKVLSKLDRAFVKYSVYRGDFESLEHKSQFITTEVLNDLQVVLGPRADLAEFIVEMPIEGVEIGMDSSTVDGQFSAVDMWGIENKDAGFLGKVVDYEDLPDAIQEINIRLSPLFKQNRTRSFFSSEIRIDKERTPFLIDPCTRCGTPPSQLYMRIFNNWSEHIWYGAAGELVDLNPIAQYGAQIQLYSQWVKTHYLPIDVPKKLRPFVCLSRPTMIGGKLYVTPGDEGVGAVIATGDTLDKAVGSCLERAEELRSIDLKYEHDALDKVLDSIQEAKDYGVAW